MIQALYIRPGDQKLLDTWVKEQLKKGYIRWSKSPQASGFFFVQKTDAKKKCPCQDYQYLNKWTKPNAYPQCQTETGWWMEGSFYNQQRTIWANSYVLWIDEFTRNFSSYDGQLLWGPD